MPLKLLNTASFSRQPKSISFNSLSLYCLKEDEENLTRMQWLINPLKHSHPRRQSGPTIFKVQILVVYRCMGFPVRLKTRGKREKLFLFVSFPITFSFSLSDPYIIILYLRIANSENVFIILSLAFLNYAVRSVYCNWRYCLCYLSC